MWRPLGLIVGLGLLNKISLLFFAFGLGVAVLVTPLRRADGTAVEWPYAMPFETRSPIHVCRGLKAPLETAWRRAKMFI